MLEELTQKLIIFFSWRSSLEFNGNCRRYARRLTTIVADRLRIYTRPSFGKRTGGGLFKGGRSDEGTKEG
jgi:hypothetical protein